METRHLALLASLACVALPAAIDLVACGGTPDTTVFQPSATDAGSSSENQFDGSLLASDAGSLLGDASEAVCPPAPVTSFAPTWKPPIAAKSGACNTTQISDFFDACLGPSAASSGCSAFVTANTSCAACLQSNDTDPKYGPVIWHSSGLYYTTNIAGCIADEQADAGTTGCGAAYQAVVQCKETACSACLSAQNPDFSVYSACEGNAESECSKFTTTLTSTCGTALTDPNNAVAACIPPSGDTAEDAYLRLAPIFCGQ
jgi:hypothetical protein